jgi:hypothetical protein
MRGRLSVRQIDRGLDSSEEANAPQLEESNAARDGVEAFEANLHKEHALFRLDPRLRALMAPGRRGPSSRTEPATGQAPT